MQLKSFALIVAGVAITTISHASFEMLLVADYVGHKIDRYDPEHGLYLGSFGANYLTSPTDIDLDVANGLAYVSDSGSGRITVFDYNLGEYLGNFFVGQTYFVSRLSDNSILSSNYSHSNAGRYSTSGSLINTINSSGIYVEGHAQTGDGVLWFCDATGTGNLYSGTVGSNTITQRYSMTNTFGLAAYLTSRGQQLAVVDYQGGLSKRISSLTTLGTNVIAESSILTTWSNSQNGGGTAIGHGGVVYAAVTNFGTSSLVIWRPGTTSYNTMALSQTTAAQGMAIVVAPEPTSMVALSVGLTAGLLRRRKR